MDETEDKVTSEVLKVMALDGLVDVTDPKGSFYTPKLSQGFTLNQLNWKLPLVSHFSLCLHLISWNCNLIGFYFFIIKSRIPCWLLLSDDFWQNITHDSFFLLVWQVSTHTPINMPRAKTFVRFLLHRTKEPDTSLFVSHVFPPSTVWALQKNKI